MKKFNRKTIYAIVIAVILSMLFSIILSISYVYRLTKINPAITCKTITDVTFSINDEDIGKDIKLPTTYVMKDDEKTASITYVADVKDGDFLFFGTIYCPLKVYVNDALVYDYGLINRFPKMFGDPPANFESIKFPDTERGRTVIRMVYERPKYRPAIRIYPPMIGDKNAINAKLLEKDGASFICAAMFLFLGIFLFFASFALVHIAPKTEALVWTGLFLVCAGTWQLSENTLVTYFIQLPEFLYILDFLSFYLLIIPLTKDMQLFLDDMDSPFLNVTISINIISYIVSLLLFITGGFPFHYQLPYFHILLIMSLFLLTLNIVYKAFIEKNTKARTFFPPFLILFVFTIFELLNYRFKLSYHISSFFQIGIMLFMLFLIIYSAIHVRMLINATVKNTELKQQLKYQSTIISANKSKMDLLISHDDEIKKQRHDIRHHLRTIDEMIKTGKASDASEYIQKIAESMPANTSVNYCDNTIVNSTISYYISQAKEHGIKTKVKLSVPDSNPNISDVDLCIIFGNLLENAIDACKHLKDMPRSISINAQVNGEMLFIYMDNTFDNEINIVDNVYQSTKHPGAGTGLTSIESTANAHEGSATFATKNDHFISEVCVRL